MRMRIPSNYTCGKLSGILASLAVLSPSAPSFNYVLSALPLTSRT